MRNRQVKNFLTVLMMAAGTPMLLMGDEIRRSQGGNNNAYCADDEANWLDWRLLERHAGLHRFVKRLTALRLRPEIVDESTRLSLNQLLQWATHRMARRRHSAAPTGATVRIRWRSRREPRTGSSRSTACSTRTGSRSRSSCRPEPDEPYRWQRCVDTALPSPDDICMLEEAPPVSDSYRVQPRSCVVLVSLLPGAGTGAGNGR